jgi:hypothetical protein
VACPMMGGSKAIIFHIYRVSEYNHLSKAGLLVFNKFNELIVNYFVPRTESEIMVSNIVIRVDYYESFPLKFALLN